MYRSFLFSWCVLTMVAVQLPVSAKVTIERDTLFKMRVMDGYAITGVLAYHDSVLIVAQSTSESKPNLGFFSSNRGNSFDTILLPGDLFLPQGPTVGIELLGLTDVDTEKQKLWRQRGHEFEILDSVPYQLLSYPSRVSVHPDRAHMLIVRRYYATPGGERYDIAYIWRSADRAWKPVRMARGGGAIDFRFDYTKRERIYSLNGAKSPFPGSDSISYSLSDDYGQTYRDAPGGVEGVGMILPGHSIVNNDSMMLMDSLGTLVDLHIRENIIRSLYPNETPTSSLLSTDIYGPEINGVAGHPEDPSTFAVRVKRDTLIVDQHSQHVEVYYGWVLTRDSGATWQWLSELAPSYPYTVWRTTLDPRTGDVYFIYVIKNTGNNAEITGVVRVRGTKTSTAEIVDAHPSSVAPNPTTGKSTIYVPNGALVTDVHVVDLMGRIQISAQVSCNDQKCEIDLSSLANGTFYILVQTHKGLYSELVVLHR